MKRKRLGWMIVNADDFCCGVCADQRRICIERWNDDKTNMPWRKAKRYGLRCVPVGEILR